MYWMGILDKQKLGCFVSQLRKEKGLTQKELAEKLYTTDKAVSKWETGTSIPDVAMLVPLAQVLGVTVTELLQGERITQDLPLAKTEALLQAAVTVNDTEMDAWKRPKMKVMLCLAVAMVIFGALPWFTYSGIAAEKAQGCGQYSVMNIMIFAILLFIPVLGGWMTMAYKRKLTGLEWVGLECCLFAIPVWCAFLFAMIVNDLQRYYNDTLGEILWHISPALYLLALTWAVFMVVLHWELLQQWRKHILAESFFHKN